MVKLVSLNLLPIAPYVRAWGLDVNVLEVSDAADKEPTRYDCSFKKLLDVLRDLCGGDDKDVVSVLDCSRFADDLCLVSTLMYSGFAPLIGLLCRFGNVDVSPNGCGGLVIETKLFDSSDSFFGALAHA